MRLFFCPKCGKEQILNDDPCETERTIINMRDGYGRVIRHYKCECGNYLAGSMSIDNWDQEGISYAKFLIKSYNDGGCFYYPEILEQAIYCYEKRHGIS